MKRIAINARKYYNTPARQYVAGQEAVVEDDVAAELRDSGVAVIIETIDVIEPDGAKSGTAEEGEDE